MLTSMFRDEKPDEDAEQNQQRDEDPLERAPAALASQTESSTFIYGRTMVLFLLKS